MGIRYGDEMIIVDAGMGFPEETPYGVDISIPNFDFLEEYRDDLTAIILTHGHEDHIGALSYILKKFNLPVYCFAFHAGSGGKAARRVRHARRRAAASRQGERRRRDRQFQDRVHPRFAFAGRLFFARDHRRRSGRSFTPAITRSTTRR